MPTSDMDYELFYYVQWPDCQMWESLDEDAQYTYRVVVDDEYALFVNKEWADEMRNNLELDL